MRAMLFACSLWVVFGCAKHQEPQPQRLDTTIRLQAPVKVWWDEVGRDDRTATVQAQIERLNAVAVPLSVHVEVPAGVTVAQGRTDFVLPANTAPGTVSETLVLTFDRVPDEDLLLHVDGDTDAMGFHFKVPYRFGRPAPVGRGPKATGPSFKKGDRDFGPTIPLDDPK